MAKYEKLHAPQLRILQDESHEFVLLNSGIDGVLKSVEVSYSDLFRSWVKQVKAFAEHPDIEAGAELMRILEDACNNQIIKASPRVLEIAENLKKLLSDSSMDADVEEVLAPVEKQAISREKSRIAKSKNADIKAFVIQEWNARENKSQTKAAFSKWAVIAIKTKFRKVIGADTIAREWIPK